jgi:predicted metal-dependent hydrolase
MEITVIRTNRKSVSISVKDEGIVVVKAPLFLPHKQIEKIVEDKKKWINERILIMRECYKDVQALTIEEINSLCDQALKEIPKRVEHYAKLLGVTYNHITIRCQKTKWGSCSSKGNLNFNCLLMLTPPEVIDSIVVHELCHLKYMNHSKKFYEEVLKIYPDYRKWDKWIKDNGSKIMARRPRLIL